MWSVGPRQEGKQRNPFSSSSSRTRAACWGCCFHDWFSVFDLVCVRGSCRSMFVCLTTNRGEGGTREDTKQQQQRCFRRRSSRGDQQGAAARGDELRFGVLVRRSFQYCRRSELAQHRRQQQRQQQCSAKSHLQEQKISCVIVVVERSKLRPPQYRSSRSNNGRADDADDRERISSATQRSWGAHHQPLCCCHVSSWRRESSKSHASRCCCCYCCSPQEAFGRFFFWVWEASRVSAREPYLVRKTTSQGHESSLLHSAFPPPSTFFQGEKAPGLGLLPCWGLGIGHRLLSMRRLGIGFFFLVQNLGSVWSSGFLQQQFFGVHVCQEDLGKAARFFLQQKEQKLLWALMIGSLILFFVCLFGFFFVCVCVDAAAADCCRRTSQQLCQRSSSTYNLCKWSLTSLPRSGNRCWKPELSHRLLYRMWAFTTPWNLPRLLQLLLLLLLHLRILPSLCLITRGMLTMETMNPVCCMCSNSNSSKQILQLWVRI